MLLRLKCFTLPALALLLLSSALLADVIHLKNGGRVEGTIEDRGETLIVTTRFGSVTLERSDVARIEQKETLRELYEQRRRSIDPKDPDQLVKLGEWCREKGWAAQATKEWQAALKLDPEHQGAHTALGHVFYEGAWRTEREIMELRGFVEVGGKWLTRREAEEALTRKQQEAARKAEMKRRRALQRRLNNAFKDIAYGTEKQAVKAVKDVETLAEEIGDPNVAKIARDAKAWYDQAWKQVRAQVISETRVTWSQLKRPIPTLTTSLGAGSTPVTLQLPELQVARVSTTVVIPAGRGE